AEAENIHQRIERINIVKRNLAAHRRHTHAIAVTRDAGHDALHQVAILRRVQLTEPEGIKQGNRPRAHCEDVAQNPTYAGCRSLVRLDERRMVVRFHFEDYAEPVADIHRARVLTGALHHPRPGCRQLLQVDAGALVRAMLRPHNREHTEFGEIRLAPQDLDYLLVLVVRQIMLRDEIFRDGVGGLHHALTKFDFRLAFLSASSIDRNINRPSSLPSMSSAHRSGCGIIPRTLPSGLMIPAMLSSEPFGFASGVTLPSGVQ